MGEREGVGASGREAMGASEEDWGTEGTGVRGMVGWGLEEGGMVAVVVVLVVGMGQSYTTLSSRCCQRHCRHHTPRRDQQKNHRKSSIRVHYE